jgi:hypothetical protein
MLRITLSMTCLLWGTCCSREGSSADVLSYDPTVTQGRIGNSSSPSSGHNSKTPTTLQTRKATKIIIFSFYPSEGK